jgi:hypothetical protein
MTNVLSRDGGASDPNPLLCRSCRVLQLRQRRHGDLAGVTVKAWVEAALVSSSTVVVERAEYGVDSWHVVSANLTAYPRTCAWLTPWNIGRRVNTFWTSARMSVGSHLGMNVTPCNSTPPDFITSASYSGAPWFKIRSEDGLYRHILWFSTVPYEESTIKYTSVSFSAICSH